MNFTRKALFILTLSNKLTTSLPKTCYIPKFSSYKIFYSAFNGLNSQARLQSPRPLNNPITFTLDQHISDYCLGFSTQSGAASHANISDAETLMVGSGSSNRTSDFEIGKIDLDRFKKEDELFLIGHALDIEIDRTSVRKEHGLIYENLDREMYIDF